MAATKTKNFRTKFDVVDASGARYTDLHVTYPGDEFHATYHLTVDDNGVKELVETGKINIVDMIQSHRESCDLQTILKRFENGDLSALNQKTPMYGDFTYAPKTMAEYYQSIIDAEQKFYSLPVEKREMFNNSPSEFFAAIGSPGFAEKMGYVNSNSESSSDQSSDVDGNSNESQEVK